MLAIQTHDCTTFGGACAPAISLCKPGGRQDAQTSVLWDAQANGPWTPSPMDLGTPRPMNSGTPRRGTPETQDEHNLPNNAFFTTSNQIDGMLTFSM